MAKGILLPISRFFILLILHSNLEQKSLALDHGQSETLCKIYEEPVTFENVPENHKTNGDRRIPALLPSPQMVKWSGQTFNPAGCAVQLINIDPSSLTIKLLSELFQGSQISAGDIAKSQRGIFLKLIPSTVGENTESYHLTVTKDSINLEACTQEGIFRGIQTLKQLQTLRKGKLVFQGCIIDDWPAFKIRGFMQDVGRNYMSLSLLKEQIDVMVAYKFNVFHFHVTDNPGWRLESKIYPELHNPSHGNI